MSRSMPYPKKAPEDRKDWQVYVLVIKFFSLGTQLPFVFKLYITPMQFAGHWAPPIPTGRRQRHPTPVLLPGKSHGQRSLVGCSPWGCEESDMTERLHFHFSLLCIGEGNGNPLQYSCLENARDGGAWWTAVYGVTQSRT